MYDVHIYINGRWTVAAINCPSVLAARAYVAGGQHAHVYTAGKCVYDTHPGQPEPRNVSA